MIKRYILVLVIFSLFGATDSLSVEVEDLYLVKWPVSEQSKSSRWKATIAGFKEVLVRKSGSKNILQSYNVEQAYSKVTNYLQRFEYSKQADRSAEQPYVIALYFEPRLIDSLIQDAKMPLWGSSRPLTILWLAIEEGTQRRIIKQTEMPDVIEKALSKSSTRRGIPLITPLMDLDDELVISISDVWGRFPSAIKMASERYSADSILYGRLSQQGELWVGKFGYINHNNAVDFEISASSQEIAINNMINKLAELLCDKYCVVEEIGEKNEIFMDISGISSFQNFKAVEKYLFGLSSVRKAEVTTVESSRTLFKITLQGQIESLVEGINLTHKMQAVDVEKIAGEDQTNIDNPVLTGESPQSDAQSNDQSDIQLQTQNSEDESGLNVIGLDIQDNVEVPAKILTLYYRWLG